MEGQGHPGALEGNLGDGDRTRGCPAPRQPSCLLPKGDLPLETWWGLLCPCQPGGEQSAMLVEKCSPTVSVPWQPGQHLSKGKLPVPDCRADSATCWHRWPRAGHGLFNLIRNVLDRNHTRGTLPLTTGHRSSRSRAPFRATATAFWVLSK